MAKTRRKRRIESKNKKQEKRFFQITILVTIALIILLYLVYRG